MRVLFTCWSWPTHLSALVPLARACRAAGHDVLVAGQPGLREDIRRAGLPAAAVGTEVDTVGMVGEYLLPLPGAGRPPAGGKPRATRMLLAHAESMAGDLVRLIREWRADLVVYDQTALAGPLAAAAAGVPAVRHLYGVDLMWRFRDALPSALAPLADRLGADAFDPFGVATVDPVPASLQPPTDYRRLPMRFTPANGSVSLTARGKRPRVCVSWGHTIAKVAAPRFLAGRIAEALAGSDVEVVLAISAAQRDLPGPLPTGTRILLDAPLWPVLSTCDLLVGHGGAASILTALDHGLPALLVPQLPDHAGHAGGVAARGAGVVLGLDELSPATIRKHVERLVAASPEREAALEVREEMHAQPSPADVVAELVALCG
ncbi:nucleotide disphospho-sugar-binding domain-containing protein [Amycolatopsis sp. NPDC059027]|uniref:nucleotide disphospho-sugar-binding domain-containing protein n=1 Tax=Amycolatopsis sp. NPDC059027 TaxID=3346709 RepID=UPI0036709B0F